jgi:hypothetical protein
MIRIARSPPPDAILEQESIFCGRLETGLATLMESVYSGSAVARGRENPLSLGPLLIPSTKMICLQPASSSREAWQDVRMQQDCSRLLQHN